MQKILVFRKHDGLLNTDIQETFMPGYAGLAVTDGHLIIPVVREVMTFFEPEMTYASLDQHPYGSVSLHSTYILAPGRTVLAREDIESWTEASNLLLPHANFSVSDLRSYLQVVKTQRLWADHGLLGSKEACLHPALSYKEHRYILGKGMSARVDSYSAFRDNLRGSTGLGDRMRRNGVRRLFIQGLAFDFCVGWSALDAMDEGFDEVYVIEDGTRSVNIGSSVVDMRRSLEAKGVRIIRSSQLKLVA